MEIYTYYLSDEELIINNLYKVKCKFIKSLSELKFSTKYVLMQNDLIRHPIIFKAVNTALFDEISLTAEGLICCTLEDNDKMYYNQDGQRCNEKGEVILNDDQARYRGKIVHRRIIEKSLDSNSPIYQPSPKQEEKTIAINK